MAEVNKQPVVVGGPEYDANGDYLSTIANIFLKINAAADSMNIDSTSWLLDYYVNLLISRIIDPEDRDLLRDAKHSLYLIEMDDMIADSGDSLGADDKKRCLITANLKVIGELSSYMDRYYGFEKKLAVML